MYVNFLSTYSDKKSCHTSTALQTSIERSVSDCCFPWGRHPMVKKFRRYLYSFWRDPRTWQTAETDGQTLHDSKDRAYAYASRGKNARKQYHQWTYTILPRDAMRKRGLCRHPVSVCPSVSVSVTFVDHVETNKDIFEIFWPSGSHAILVFPYQTA